MKKNNLNQEISKILLNLSEQRKERKLFYEKILEVELLYILCYFAYKYKK